MVKGREARCRERRGERARYVRENGRRELSAVHRRARMRESGSARQRGKGRCYTIAWSSTWAGRGERVETAATDRKGNTIAKATAFV